MDALIRVIYETQGAADADALAESLKSVTTDTGAMTAAMTEATAAQRAESEAGKADVAAKGEVSAATRGATEATSKHAAELKTAKQSQDSATSSWKEGAIQLGLVTGAATVAVAAIVSLTSSYVENALQAQKMATMAGTTVEAFSMAAGVAEDFGVSGETVSHSLVILQRQLQASGDEGDKFKGILKELDIDVNEFKDSSTATTDILYKLQGVFSTLEDGPQKTALAMKLFSRGGPEMLEFLNQTQDTVNENATSFNALGLTITKADVEISRSIKGVMNDMGDLKESVETNIGRAMAPIFLSTMTAMKDAAESSMETILESFGGMEGAVETMKRELEDVSPIFATLAGGTVKVLAAAFAETAAAGAAFVTGLRVIGVAAGELFDMFGLLSAKARKSLDESYGKIDESVAFGVKAQEAAGKMLSSIGEVSGAEKQLVADRDAAREKWALSAEKAKAIFGEETEKKKETAAAEEKLTAAAGKTNEALEFRKNLTRDQILDERALAEAKDHELAIVHEQSEAYARANSEIERCASAHQQQLFIIGDVNVGLHAMAAATAAAADEAAQLESKLLSAVNAQSSLSQIKSGQQMGPAGGGVQVGDRFIPYPQQGLPGAAGMSAVANFQADLASAIENERQQKANKAAAGASSGASAAAGRASGGGRSSGGASGSGVAVSREMTRAGGGYVSSIPGDPDPVRDHYDSALPPGLSYRTPGQSKLRVYNDDGTRVTPAPAKGTPEYAALTELMRQMAADMQKAVTVGVSAGVADGMQGVTMSADSRVIAELMVDQTRKGQRTTTLSGSTNRTFL